MACLESIEPYECSIPAGAARRRAAITPRDGCPDADENPGRDLPVGRTRLGRNVSVFGRKAPCLAGASCVVWTTDQAPEVPTRRAGSTGI